LLWSLAAPAAAALIHDLRNPDGLLRSYVRKKVADKTVRKSQKAVDGEYEVVADKPVR